MTDTVIKVENLTKKYKLGVINTGMLTKDLQSWWSRKLGKDDPNARIHENVNEKGEILALNNLNFEVKRGEVLGIIGANGAGKSTLLKILAQVTAPTSGSVKIKGRVGSLLEVGTGFHPELTGRENIFLNGAILGMKKWEIKKKFDEIVDFSGVETFIDTPVKRYSSGMCVRLAFAVAAHLDPEILVIDEVLAVGDAEFQKRCLGKMGDISKKEGRTVLFVSHNMGAVKRICKKCLVISDGKIVFNGKTVNAISFYLDNCISVKNDTLKWAKKSDNYSKTCITNVFVSSEGSPRSFATGDTVIFKIDYFCENFGANIDLNIGVYNCLGEKISHLGTWFSGMSIKYDGKEEAVCKIKKLPYNEGKYYFNFSLFENGERVDHLLNAVSISVEKGDYYKTGNSIEDINAPFFVDCVWE